MELFYDVISPYSWVAFEILCRYRTQWNLTLELKPFLLGGVMQASGNSPPAKVPAKGPYMLQDLERIRRHAGIPLTPPKDFASTILRKGSLKAQRLLTAASLYAPDAVEALSRAFWRRTWENVSPLVLLNSYLIASPLPLHSLWTLVDPPHLRRAVSLDVPHTTTPALFQDLDITEDASLAHVCKEAGVDEALSAKLLGSIAQQDVKDRLKKVTEEAVERGAFGAPIIFTADGQMFFGSDRFDLIGAHIGNPYLGPFPEASLSSRPKAAKL